MAPYVTEPRFLYRESEDPHTRERCTLDLYRPAAAPGFATIVFFHGGGMTGGEPYVPEPLLDQGYAVAACGYRLSPHVQAPAYLDDAAAAVAWVVKNIDRFGGDPSRVLVSGFSAGSYLVMMMALDKTYLARHGVDADAIAGYLPLSGQAITHAAIRREQGVPPPEWRPCVDSMAPLYHVRPDARPMLFITGDWPLDINCRAYENAYLVALLRHAGHRDVEHIILPGVGHEEQNPLFWSHAMPFIRRILDAPPVVPTT